MRLLNQLVRSVWPQNLLAIQRVDYRETTAVDSYWGQHTVNSNRFKNVEKSLKYLEWRFTEYPLFRELMDLYGRHDNEVVLDYGCGPGNDLVGFLVHTRAKKVIGIDVSWKALHLARTRLALHGVEPGRLDLIQVTDSAPGIPLEEESVDYIYCEGVLHHVSHPHTILKEFNRVLKRGSSACIMVYNRNSLWLHLYTAYQKMILENAFPGMDLLEAFSKNTDGQQCPIARCYAPGEFMAMCRDAHFYVEYAGGYFSSYELKLWQDLGEKALRDDRLGTEQKQFLSSLNKDQDGYPRYKGKHAGIGGVYRLRKL
jgi:ubiquinone/menaquinone biosynthesis C-methylase UbiE